jgi:energy-coupling factor transporter ATP-binding protein EcfA2
VVGERDRVSFAVDGAPGIEATGWLETAPGVTLLVGRNNVGKTRLLRLIASRFSAQAAQLPNELGSIARLRLGTADVELRVGLNSDRLLDSYVVAAGGQQDDGVNRESQPPSELVFGGEPANRWAAMSTGTVRWTIGSMSGLRFEGDIPTPDAAILRAFIDSTRLIPAERAIDQTVPTSHTVAVPDGSSQSLGQALFYHLNNDTPQYVALLDAIGSMIPEIEKVLTTPTISNQVTISVRDRYAGSVISLGQVGAGVGQLLYLLATILFEKPGRVLLIDEPTVHLHPAAERQLASFLLAHPEHRYVCATHAAAFINAVSPTTTWLVKRGADGIRVHGSRPVQALRQHLSEETGISPADAVLWDKMVLVEGPVDVAVLPILCRTLGLPVTEAGVELLPLGTGTPDRHLLSAAFGIAADGGVRVEVYLDGDKKVEPSPAGIDYLPVLDVESFLVIDAQAVFVGLTGPAQRAAGRERAEVPAWTQPAAELVLRELRAPGVKGKKVLIDLCQRFGFEYVPVAHGALIAAAVAPDQLEPYRNFFERLVG